MKILGNTGITKLIDLIASKFAPADSPALTGTPTAPTAALGTNTNQIATTAFVSTKVGDYLPLSGGTMTGNIYGTPAYDSELPNWGKVTFGTKGIAAKGTFPSAIEYHTMFVATDNSGDLNENAYKYGQIETAVNVNGSTETKLEVFKNEANSTERSYLAVGYDASGNAYTYAPTPPAGNNSTQIATTAFIKSAITTGSTNGTISVSGSDVAVKGLGSAAYTASTAYAAASHTHSYLSNRPGSIEMQPASTTTNNGGFIDFHYNQSTADYTSRIIESPSGQLNVIGKLKITGDLTVNNGLINYNASTGCLEISIV